MFSLSAKVLLCIVVCLSLHSEAKLGVRNPRDGIPGLNEVNAIDYTILTPQNKITYKKSFVGRVILAEPQDACSNLTSINTIDDTGIYNPILLVSWGTCHYAQKVKNAEAAGAKMVLLVLRHDMPLNHPITRQITLSTNIEVLAISKGDGDTLIKFMEDHDPIKNPQAADVLELQYSYEVEKHPHYQSKDKVDIQFWFSASDTSKASYQFLGDLREILKGFTEHFNFNPGYVLWQAHEQSVKKFNEDHERCLSGGRYCDPEHFIKDRLTGADGVLEDLRQIAFKKLSTNLKDLNADWWKYVPAFGQSCVDKNLTEIGVCRDQVYNDVGILAKTEADVEREMLDSFEGKPKSIEDCKKEKTDNTDLNRELKDRNENQVDHYPAFYVNKERYTGSFRNRVAVLEFICSHFIHEVLPLACQPVIGNPPSQPHTSHDIGMYVAIVFVSILIMAVMLYCVRRAVKRQVMGRMNDEISHIVTQYKQFKDKSNTSGADDDM